LSNALGISAVTAALESMLWGVYNGPDWSSSQLGAVAVTAVAPDIVQSNLGNGADVGLQVNLFLHQVTFNAAWRNMGLPSLAADGVTQLKNPPLALDLHYLLTVYASEDCEAEALLGYALQYFHENPVLRRAQIGSALANLTSPSFGFDTATNLVPTTSLFKLVTSSGIADQIEMLKITPDTLGREEMAWLWTALKADYRPTFPFQVSVLLIQPQIPAVSALPVLKRSVTAQPNMLAPFGTLTQITPPNSQPAAFLQDIVTVTGANLDGVNSVTLSNDRLGIELKLTTSNVSDNSFQFALPLATATNLPAGVYLVSAQVGSENVSTNALPLAIAPQITNLSAPPPTPPFKPGTQVNVTVTCSPYLFAGQQASLLIGSQETLWVPPIPPAPPMTSPTNSLQFTVQVPRVTVPTTIPLRLRVDSIDSLIIDMTAKPPKFFDPSDPPANFVAYVQVMP
jgi:hypothetical protein